VSYQKRNKGPRYQTTGSIIGSSTRSNTVSHEAYKWNTYLKGEMKKLQNRARQLIFKSRPYLGTCLICQEADTSWFYVDYGNPPQVLALCQKHHKEYSQMRGSLYDQLSRHGLKPISWEEWKNGLRPVTDTSK
jgi:hypothetical protein